MVSAIASDLQAGKVILTKRGRLIAFSGLDGAGKSTQINLLLADLRARGQRPVYCWSRGGYTPLFGTLKGFLRRLARGRIVPPTGPSERRSQALDRPGVRRLWLTLALLDLLWFYGVQMRCWLWRGRTVVADRYVWDTLIDFRLNFPQEAVEQWLLWRWLVKATPKPDAAFLLLIPVAESLRRSDRKGEPFRDPPAVLAERLAQYQALAQRGCWHLLDGSRPIADLAGEIAAIVDGVGVAPVAQPVRYTSVVEATR